MCIVHENSAGILEMLHIDIEQIMYIHVDIEWIESNRLLLLQTLIKHTQCTDIRDCTGLTSGLCHLPTIKLHLHISHRSCKSGGMKLTGVEEDLPSLCMSLGL